MFKVLKDFKGSPDGFTVIEYEAGQQVSLEPGLAEVARAEGWVEQITDLVTAAEAAAAAPAPQGGGQPRRSSRRNAA